jgi:hypothetical protein
VGTGVVVFHILQNTQRREKVKGRKGKRADVVVEFRSVRSWSIGVWGRNPFFAVVMLQEVIMELFEGLKS